jgi:hypothetical protein
VRAAVVRVAAVRMADARGEVRLRESFEVERERYATARDVCVCESSGVVLDISRACRVVPHGVRADAWRALAACTGACHSPPRAIGCGVLAAYLSSRELRVPDSRSPDPAPCRRRVNGHRVCEVRCRAVVFACACCERATRAAKNNCCRYTGPTGGNYIVWISPKTQRPACVPRARARDVRARGAARRRGARTWDQRGLSVSRAPAHHLFLQTRLSTPLCHP